MRTLVKIQTTFILVLGLTGFTACSADPPRAASLDRGASSPGSHPQTDSTPLPASDAGADATATDGGDTGDSGVKLGDVLAGAQEKPGSLTRAGGYLYWLQENAGDGKLLRMPIGGGAPTTIATGLVQPDSLRVDDARAYWLAYGEHAGIQTVAVGGGAVSTLVAVGAPVPIVQLALGPDHVYYTDGPGGAVRRVAKAGGDPETVASDLSGPGQIAVSDGVAFVIEGGEHGAITRIEATGPRRLAAEQPTPTSLLVAGNDVLWVNAGRFDATTQRQDGAAIMRVPKIGGAATVVLATEGASNLGSAGNDVLYVQNDAIYRLPPGGAPTLYAPSESTPRALIADDTYAYWANAGTSAKLYLDGQIRRLSLR